MNQNFLNDPRLCIAFFKDKPCRYMFEIYECTNAVAHAVMKDRWRNEEIYRISFVNVRYYSGNDVPKCYKKLYAYAARLRAEGKPPPKIEMKYATYAFDAAYFDVLVEFTFDIGGQILLAFSANTAKCIVDGFQQFKYQQAVYANFQKSAPAIKVYNTEKHEETYVRLALTNKTPQEQPKAAVLPSKAAIKTTDPEYDSKNADCAHYIVIEKFEPTPKQNGDLLVKELATQAQTFYNVHCVCFDQFPPTRLIITGVDIQSNYAVLNFNNKQHFKADAAHYDVLQLPKKYLKQIQKCYKYGRKAADKIMAKNKLKSITEICLGQSYYYYDVCAAIYSQIVVLSRKKSVQVYGLKPHDAKLLCKMVNDRAVIASKPVYYPIVATKLEDATKCVLFESYGIREGCIQLVRACPTHLIFEFQSETAGSPLEIEVLDIQDFLTGKQTNQYAQFESTVDTKTFPVELMSPDDKKVRLAFFDISWRNLCEERLASQFNNVEAEDAEQSKIKVEYPYQQAIQEEDILPSVYPITSLPRETPKVKKPQIPVAVPPYYTAMPARAYPVRQVAVARAPYIVYYQQEMLKNSYIDSELSKTNICLLFLDNRWFRAYFKFAYVNSKTVLLLKPFYYKFYYVISILSVKLGKFFYPYALALNAAKPKAEQEMKASKCIQFDACQLEGDYDNYIFRCHVVITCAKQQQFSIFVEQHLADSLIKSFQ